MDYRSGVLSALVLVLFALFGIELGETAKIVFQLIVFGIGSLPAGALHHKAAEYCKHQNAEGEVECPGSAAAQNEIHYRGGDDKNVRNPFVNA